MKRTEAELIKAITEDYGEETETIKGHIVFDDGFGWSHTLYAEVEIPNGLTGSKRKKVAQDTAFNKMRYEEL